VPQELRLPSRLQPSERCSQLPDPHRKNIVPGFPSARDLLLPYLDEVLACKHAIAKMQRPQCAASTARRMPAPSPENRMTPPGEVGHLAALSATPIFTQPKRSRGGLDGLLRHLTGKYRAAARAPQVACVRHI
jgi:hypothetical protein